MIIMHKNTHVLMYAMNKAPKSSGNIIENVDTFYASP